MERDQAVRLTQNLLKKMVEHNGSDLFITADFPPAIKIDGSIKPFADRPLTSAQSSLIVRSIMNDKQAKEFDSTKECNFAIAPQGIGRFRVSAFVAQGHVGAVIRTIVTKIPTFEDLELPAQLKDVAMTKRGLCLVVGGTGSGKSTTLAAMIGFRNESTRGHIITIEDPVEYVHPHRGCVVTHREVGVDTESWHNALKNTLRQAPDVIMIGEIRDEETASTAVRAANSGHLVLATMHAPVAAGAVQSMRALGAHPFFLSSSLLGIVAQRLVRVLCQNCRVAYDISESPETFAEIRDLLEPGLGSFIYGPSGCEKCRRQGYTGQAGVFEIMTFNRELRQMVLAGRPTDDVQKQAIEQGMIEFRRAAMLKVAQGITSTEEVLRELPTEYLGLEM